MICRMAFFRLFARSISCSRGLKMDTAEGGGAERGEQDGALRGEEGRWAGSGSRGSSAMVGEGGAGRADKAWDSSLRVFSRESSFSFSTPHCSRHTHTHRQGSETHTHTHRHRSQTQTVAAGWSVLHLTSHGLRFLRTLSVLLVSFANPSHKVLHRLAQHSGNKSSVRNSPDLFVRTPSMHCSTETSRTWQTR